MSQKNIQSDSVQNPGVTWEGCSVLLDINDGDRLVFARLTAGSTLKIGNKNYSLRPLIGCPFGSSFQIENGAEGPYLSRFIPSTEEKGGCQIMDECRDNRTIVDNNEAQTLTSDDIDEMRRQGAKGDEIIEALIANSATFEKKTAFSQEKYRIKKQKKYAPRVLLRRPSAKSICEAYFKKYPNRIGFLRVDALSLLLSLANVTANSDILLVDMVGGLLTGAVAERLGGTGYVCNTYLGSTPSPVEIVRTFNFNDEICKRIVRAPLRDLCSDQTGTTEEVDSCNAESNGQISSISKEEMPLPSEHEAADSQTIVSPQSKMGKAPKAGEKASEEALKSWKENGFSSLIIAAPDADAWSLVKVLLPLLSYSSPFAIYHQYLQPLATCMHNLQQGKMAIGMQISEPWLREYQVLPSRTHPSMQMSAFGGYILSGTKICTGYVCNTYLGSTPSPVEIVRTFNFDNEICKRIVQAPLHDLCSGQTGTAEEIDSCNAESNGQISSISKEEMPLPSEHEAADSQTIVSPQSKMGKAPKAGEKASEEALKSWKENGFSSLIIAASDADAWSLVKVLLPLLSYSSPFAIYHQYLQPLATCMHNLQLGKMAIGMQISEPWLREYQVLPSRTHPSMQMSAFGGYILSGTKLCSSC